MQGGFFVLMLMYVAFRVAVIEPYTPQELHNFFTVLSWIIPGWIGGCLDSNAHEADNKWYPRSLRGFFLIFFGPIGLLDGIGSHYDAKARRSMREFERQERQEAREAAAEAAEEFRKRYKKD
jgi:hypothetical protein